MSSLPPNIVLLGFMGTGKSAVAREIGKRLRRPVVEMDGEIEKREGMVISRIFAERGEPYFRSRERELVQKLSRSGGKVIAAGGGVVLDPANLRALARRGVLVRLDARPEVILRRVEREGHRPLLEGGDRLSTIKRLLAARRSFYDAIENRIDTSDLSVAAVADRIVALLPESKRSPRRSMEI